MSKDQWYLLELRKEKLLARWPFGETSQSFLLETPKFFRWGLDSISMCFIFQIDMTLGIECF
jgi:hypothetical protein